MTDLKPRYPDEWNAVAEFDFDEDSMAYGEIDYAALEALTVHLGNEHYFDGYAE